MSRISRQAGVAVIKFGNDPVIRAAWLYYAEQRTQAEIATALGISRATVANHLAQARQTGLVSVQLSPDLLRGLGQAEALETRFGLSGAHVIPTLPSDAGEETALRQRLGRAGADVLATMLTPDTVLGVAWGRTMADLAQALPKQDLPDLRVVQISGSSLGDEATSPEACTVHIATRLGAHCHNFHAPAVVSTAALRDLLMQELPLAQHFRRVQSCATVVFGVGELTETTRWADGDQMISPVAAEYLTRGSAGILIGRFIDACGAPVDGPLGGRQIGMELEDLREIETRLCVAGGSAKAPAIRAALTGGYVTHLVTDSATAAHVLEA
ncbi:MAG: sugar-binding transcriptional regulator [Pseudomonadota bacterium]